MLRRARTRRGLGQGETGRLVGLSQGYISNLERGQRTPSLTVAEALADVLGLSLRECQQLYAAAVTDAGRYSRQRLPQAA
ncbi:helix-turn-helix transcriptional regulator [Streptomyces griseoluteus]|uniref:helix-turn-helix transcriptional regulator n=1 Tax=Streptomyces griseoluteus TaxID=29306 RepID=UPI0033288BD6